MMFPQLILLITVFSYSITPVMKVSSLSFAKARSLSESEVTKRSVANLIVLSIATTSTVPTFSELLHEFDTINLDLR